MAAVLLQKDTCFAICISCNKESLDLCLARSEQAADAIPPQALSKFRLSFCVGFETWTNDVLTPSSKMGLLCFLAVPLSFLQGILSVFLSHAFIGSL